MGTFDEDCLGLERVVKGCLGLSRDIETWRRLVGLLRI